MEFCTEGEVNSAFFRASFLRRLPREIRVLLATEVRSDMAVHADELFQHHRPNVVTVVDIAVDEDLAKAMVAFAVCSGKTGFCRKKKEGGAGGGSGGSGGSNGSSGSGKSYFFCDCHWKYGAKAFGCDTPTSTSGRQKTRKPGGSFSPLTTQG